MTPDQLSSLATLANAAARHAGELLRCRPEHVDHKGAADLVTEIDLASEARIRAALAPCGIPVQGEEHGGVATGLRWVVDPLDGTTNFVHDYPFYCVSIGLVDDTVPIIGAIYDPIRDRLYAAHGHSPTTRDGKPVRVSQARRISDSLCVTGFPMDRREHTPRNLPYVERSLLHSHGIRRSGSAAMDLATVAAGQVDVYWEFGLKAWDTAAGQLIVQNAGGVVCRLDGTQHAPGDPEIIATNPYLRDELLALFADLHS